MKTYRVLAALLAAAAMHGAQAGDWMPTAGLQLTFGGPSPARLTANLGSALRTSELPAPLPLTRFTLDSTGSIGGALLGVPLAPRPDRVHQDETAEVTSSNYSYTLVWVAAGVTAVALALAGGVEDDEGDGYTNRGSGGCNIVGGTINGTEVLDPDRPPIYVIGPDCEGVPGNGTEI